VGTLELDIRIPSSTRLGAGGIIELDVTTSATGISAGINCYNKDSVFLGRKNFLLNGLSIGTGDVSSVEFIFDEGGSVNEFIPETTFVKPVISWTTLVGSMRLGLFMVRPLDLALKSLYA